MPERPIKIAPSILAANFARLGEEVSSAEAAGADLIHIDVMDGRFVPNITMGPMVVTAVRRCVSIPLDVHLMIVEPERYLEQFAGSGADSITVHLEACAHLHRVLGQIAELGCRAGVALNPHTPMNALSEVLHLLDVINVMTVNPGFGGQRFIAGMSNKISQLRAAVDERDLNIDIEVDGGITSKTLPIAAAAGANVMIAGTCIFGHERGIVAGIQELREAQISMGVK